MIIRGKKKIRGSMKLPGDKSISHRGIILGAISEGSTKIENILLSKDILSTIECFKNMGVDINIQDGSIVHIKGRGLRGLEAPKNPLDCGNSGTTMRLISGILIGQNFSSTIIGDESLSRRPMDRIIEPLQEMGGNIRSQDNNYPPIIIEPEKGLKSIIYTMPMASAQVKSAILLAGLYCNGRTKIIENKISRDHTERMLSYLGVPIEKHNNSITLEGRDTILSKDIFVPGDISSAAFWLVAATILEGSSLKLIDVGLNPTRTGIIHVLRDMGADIQLKNLRILNNEPMGDIYVKHSPLKGIELDKNIIGTLIDEIPIIAVAASLARGTTIIRGAEELRVKETDRIKAVANELRKMGVDIEELPDGLIIHGKQELKASSLNTYNDHRIAMALSIAALSAEGNSQIDDINCINISYPNFLDNLRSLME